jgi:hypothetical protein
MCKVHVGCRCNLYSYMTGQWRWARPLQEAISMLAFASCRVDRNPALFSRERLSFVLRGTPNGDTHHLEVCAEEEILHADESRAG